jgi:hypothetical protein
MQTPLGWLTFCYNCSLCPDNVRPMIRHCPDIASEAHRMVDDDDALCAARFPCMRDGALAHATQVNSQGALGKQEGIAHRAHV